VNARLAAVAVVLVSIVAACGTGGGEPLDVRALIAGAPSRPASGAGSLDDASDVATGGLGAEGTSTAASPGAAGAAGAHGADAGGITGSGPSAGTVEIGVRYVTGADQLVNLLGAQGFSVPDTKAMAQAMIDDINARGGLAGLQIVPVWHAYDASDPAGTATQEQTACSFFTEDHHVPVVVSPIFSSEVLQTCLAERGVVLVDENYGFFDMALAPDTYFVPGYPDPVRAAGALVDDLVARGFFGDTPRIGITMKDSPDRNRVAQGIEAALARHGLKVADEIRYTSDHPEAIGSGILRFRATGVSHVFVLDIGGLESGVLMQAAEIQGYRPKYALDTRNSLDYLRKNVPVAQLHGAAGLGWFPASDVGRGPGAEPGEPEARCADVMRAAGVELRDSGNDRIAYATCDVFLALAAGANRGGAVDAGAIRAGIESLGAFRPTGTFASRFGPGRHDGTTHARRIAFDDGCACFRYAGDLVAIG